MKIGDNDLEKNEFLGKYGYDIYNSDVRQNIVEYNDVY
jgi:hypothetical protein